MSNEARDHYHEDGNIVPRFRSWFQLWGLKLTISVCIRNTTFPVKFVVSLIIFVRDCRISNRCNIIIIVITITRLSFNYTCLMNSN